MVDEIMFTAFLVCFALMIIWINIMILSIIMFMLVVCLQVHSMYWPGVLCQFSGKSNRIGVLPCLDRVHIGVPMLWSPASSSSRCRVVVVTEAPLCSLNNVHIVQPHRVCRLALLLDVISHYVSARINKVVVFCTRMLCVARRLDLWVGNARNRLLWAGVPHTILGFTQGFDIAVSLLWVSHSRVTIPNSKGKWYE